MEGNNDILKKVNETFKVIEIIDDVYVSPSFKDKTMRRLFSKKEEESYVWSWFTPKIQLATLTCVVILNVVAFSQLKQDTYNNDISQFAESYGFSIDNETSLIK